jgi:hypothetical protein
MAEQPTIARVNIIHRMSVSPCRELSNCHSDTGIMPAMPGSLDTPSVAFVAKVAKTKKIAIAELFRELGLKAPAQLMTDHIDVVVEATGGWTAHAALANAPGWTLPIGPPQSIGGIPTITAQFRDLTLDVARKNGVSTATFEGTMDLGRGVTLHMQYVMPGEIAFDGSFGAVSIAQIAKLFRPSIDFPAGFDLTFGENNARIEKSGDIFTLSASTEIADVGEFQLTASREDGEWSCRLEGTLEADPSRLPGLKPLAPLIAASGLREPKLKITTHKEPWLRCEGRIRSGAFSQHWNTLLDLAGITMDGSQPMTLEVHSNFDRCKVTIPFEGRKYSLKGLLGLRFERDYPAVFLDGTWTTSFGTFLVSGAGVMNGIMITGSAPDAQVSIAGFGTLRNLGMTVGFNYEGIPSFGFAGTFDTRAFEMSVAFFANSTDPSKSVIAAAMDKVTLNDLVTTFGGLRQLPAPIADLMKQIAISPTSAFDADAKLAAALDARDVVACESILSNHGLGGDPLDLRIFVNAPGSRWHFTQSMNRKVRHSSASRTSSGVRVELQGQFYVAPQTTAFAGQEFKQGMWVAAFVELFMLRAWIDAEVVPDKGVRVQTRLDPITIGGSQFIELRGGGGWNGPELSIATYDNPTATDAARRGAHAIVSGSLFVLRAHFASATLNANSSGAILHLAADLTAIIHADLSVTVRSTSSASIRGNATVAFPSLDLEIGRIPSPVTVSAAIEGSLSKGTTITASFALFGMNLSIPSIPLTMPLGELDSFLREHMTKAIVDAFGLASFTLLTRAGLIVFESATPLAAALVKHFGQTIPEAATTLHELGHAGADVVKALRDLTSDPQAALRALISAGYHVGEVALSMSRLFSASPQLIVDVATAAYGGVKNISGAAVTEMAVVLRDLFSFDADRVAGVFRKAGYSAADVGRSLNSAGYAIANIAVVLAKDFQWTAEQTADFLKNGLNVAQSGVDSALKAAGYAAHEVSGAIEKLWSRVTPSNW